MNEEYKPNSHKFREGQTEALTDKKIQKVVHGKVKTKPKSGMSKITDVFISEDAANVKSYIVMDVLVPAVKKAISDIVRDGIDMILYGESRGRRNSTSSSYVSYRDYSRSDDRDRFRDSRTRSGYTHDDIILESRGEAEEVLTRMDELIDTYGVVSVADLYDLIGKSCEYTDNKYGWTNIRNAEPIRVRDGYMLKLPKALPIK
mgnify:CR=1 FL=1